jgi:hypothetical protein
VDTHRAAKRRRREREFMAILPTPGAGGSGTPPRIRVILDALQDEPWMPFLRHWRRGPARLRVIRYPADFDAVPAV